MKKTSLIILTLVASLAISLSTAEGNPRLNVYPPDLLTEQESEGDTTKYDTIRHDSTQYYQQNQVSYNYYYRNRLFDNPYRLFRPRRYYTVIHQTGYVPRHVRADHARGITHSNGVARSSCHRSNPGGGRRGGFGHLGTTHTQTN